MIEEKCEVSKVHLDRVMLEFSEMNKTIRVLREKLEIFQGMLSFGRMLNTNRIGLVNSETSNSLYLLEASIGGPINRSIKAESKDAKNPDCVKRGKEL